MKISAKKSNPQSLWKYAFIAPLVFTLLLFINKPNIAIANEINNESISLSESPVDESEEKKSEKLDIATFLENYSKLSDAEKKELLRLLKGTTTPETTLKNKTSDESDLDQAASITPSSTERPLNHSESSNNQNLNARNVIADLDNTG